MISFREALFGFATPKQHGRCGPVNAVHVRCEATGIRIGRLYIEMAVVSVLLAAEMAPGEYRARIISPRSRSRQRTPTL